MQAGQMEKFLDQLEAVVLQQQAKFEGSHIRQTWWYRCVMAPGFWAVCLIYRVGFRLEILHIHKARALLRNGRHSAFDNLLWEYFVTRYSFTGFILFYVNLLYYIFIFFEILFSAAVYFVIIMLILQ